MLAIHIGPFKDTFSLVKRIWRKKIKVQKEFQKRQEIGNFVPRKSMYVVFTYVYDDHYLRHLYCFNLLIDIWPSSESSTSM